MVPTAAWWHVASGVNPADVASRGLTSAELITCDLWWQGPVWLIDETSWPHSTLPTLASIPEERNVTTQVALPTLLVNDLLLHHSNLERSLRVTSYVFRFIRNCRIPKFLRKKGSPLISIAERKHALCFWIKHVQHVEFPAEYDCLRRKVPIKKSSPLSSLNPFMDSSNMIRVGGRLDHSALSYEQKHPMVLP